MAAVVLAACTVVLPVPAASAAPARSCADMTSFAPPRTKVLAAKQDSGDSTTPPSCRLTLRVADPVDSGSVTVWVYLPTRTWNGRFQGVGGGGFSGGNPDSLVAPLRAGYAAAATDVGHVGATADFALNADGSLNWPAIEDYGYEGIQDMTVTAKAAVRAFYGKAPAYSYFNGCSTGGRQGLMEAQRFPDEYDGVLAGAPVINYSRMQTAQIWGQVVMLESRNPVAACKFDTAVKAEIAACDTVGDGVRDGVIGDPLSCRFDMSSLVGKQTPCGTITATDVAVMKKIQEGARDEKGRFLWYGLAPGAPFAGLNDTVEKDGKLVGAPFVYDLWWISLFLEQDRSWDWTTLTYERFENYFRQAVRQYNDILGADNPDLSRFQRSGGKAVIWHGKADFGVPYQGTIDYIDRVRQKLGPARTDQFARLFLAPGVGHCRGGDAPQLTDPFGALVDWVEHGKAPVKLDARITNADGTVAATRPVCVYPTLARWTGKGDAKDGRNYRCVPSRG
ncbi:feruloyl esterase [Kibdelosporangium banguiense]|uniref:Feruloyl esterase n=1 Tax=Kibdelosporangium banguiense TaxID=1365924 RepID=A0ABS4TRC0_9PSEU|nr:tannase/feruloyl esterase family alpha/beta hydrolase [Kibdelosporangium banguiense]MBP2326954.1 feruloyl esterase [Kibdelosporangium banguiense]